MWVLRARKVGGIRGHLGTPRGCRGVRGVLGLTGSVGTQGPEGYRWHKGALGVPRGVGASGGVGGVRGHWGGNRDRECWDPRLKPMWLGSQSRIPALPMVSLGE